jgi:hypothetical protein
MCGVSRASCDVGRMGEGEQLWLVDKGGQHVGCMYDNVIERCGRGLDLAPLNIWIM